METYRTRSVAIPEPYLRFKSEIRARERHLDILVVAWVVMGAFYVLYGLGLSALLIVAVGTLPDGSDPALRLIMPLFAVAVLLTCLGMSAWYLLTAWGLHRRTRWARISSYVVAGVLAATVCLLPLSLYAFWALIGSVADMAFGRFEQAVSGRPGTGAEPMPEPAPSPGLQPPDPAAAPARSRERRETGPRSAAVVPPESQPFRPGVGTYPKPHVAQRTPPTGIPKYAPDVAGHVTREKKDLSTMETIDDMPAPKVKKGSLS